MSETFKAFVVDKTDDGFDAGVRELSLDDLPEGEVTIRVKHSSFNFKDGLALLPESPVVTSYPMVPGIDIAGTVTESSDPRFTAGQEVVAIGRGLGTDRFGGYSEYARVPADFVEPLPEGLTLREAMALGTAGFTAALAIQRLEDNGLRPGAGQVLVLGASGGVGSAAVNMLAGLGYEVVASTGKADEHDYLKELGAKEVIGRDDISSPGPLGPQRWIAAVDPVGGDPLATVLSTTVYGGAVATCGLTAGSELHTTVLPFILRGVSLLGVDSVMCPPDVRAKLWQRLATDLKPSALTSSIATEVGLDGVPELAGKILAGAVRGRTIVNI